MSGTHMTGEPLTAGKLQARAGLEKAKHLIMVAGRKNPLYLRALDDKRGPMLTSASSLSQATRYSKARITLSLEWTPRHRTLSFSAR
eukprot:2989605-Rhodomonas_salina.2